MHMRGASASSRASGTSSGSGGVTSSSTSTSRRYRRVAHSPQVDDTLFGNANKPSQLKKGNRSMQTGRDIVGGGSSNQDHEPPPPRKHPVASKPTTLLDESELQRMKHETRILTALELEELEAKRDADLEQQRLTSKKRKDHMLQLSEEAARRAPKSQIEQILDHERDQVLRRATVLKEQTHDSVKLLRTLGARAQAFTIRDQQKKLKEVLDDEKLVYDEKMNVLMEVDRLDGLKKQEEIDESKKAKRYADRHVLEVQIDERRRQRELEAGRVAHEAAEMRDKIHKQQVDDAEKERRKAERAHQTMAEIHAFNAQSLTRRADEKKRRQDEDDQVVAYQRRKADEQKALEDEEERKRHEAELRCAKLRSAQEKMANDKAELDELRAKRAADARERQAREAELALMRKQKAEMEDMRAEREAQAMHRQRARIKEATMQQSEYESIMAQVQADKTRVRETNEKKQIASMAHRRVLQSQIEDKEKSHKLVFVQKQAEGQALKDEYAEELAKLERIRLQEVEELIQAGVNPLYLSEMKALDIERIRNR